MKLNPALIRAELEYLLSSPKIRSRKLIKQFLRYVVEETLAGRGAELNQYNIAVYGLSKPVDFSPVYNPIIRIEAGRLRKLLTEHYESADHGSEISILMPKGSYQVEFHPLHQVDTPLPKQPSMPGTTEGPRVLLHLQTLPQTDTPLPPLYRIHGELLLALSRFRNIRLVSSTLLETCQPLTRQYLQTLHTEYQADYILNGNISYTTDGFELSFTLAHTLTDQLVWQAIIPAPQTLQQTDIQRICHEVAANTVSVHSGLMLRHWAQYLQNQSVPLIDHQAALACYLNFLRNITPENFVVALKSCQQRLQQCPDDSKAFIILARLCGYDHVLHYQQIPELEQTWTKAARMAMKLDPGNAEAHSVFAHNTYYRGDFALCRAELEIARQANPFDTAGEFMRAMALFFLGDKQYFVESIGALLAIRFNPPDWYHIPLFLHHFNEGNYQQALTCAERIQYFGHWGELTRCVSYFHLGQQTRAMTELAQLLEKHPHLLQADAAKHLPFVDHPTIQPLRKTLEKLASLLA